MPVVRAVLTAVRVKIFALLACQHPSQVEKKVPTGEAVIKAIAEYKIRANFLLAAMI